MAGMYPLAKVYNSEFIQTTGHFARYIHTVVALFGERLKYYFAWKVAEGASIMAGFGFQGYDANDKVIGWSGIYCNLFDSFNGLILNDD